VEREFVQLYVFLQRKPTSAELTHLMEGQHVVKSLTVHLRKGPVSGERATML